MYLSITLIIKMNHRSVGPLTRDGIRIPMFVCSQCAFDLIDIWPTNPLEIGGIKNQILMKYRHCQSRDSGRGGRSGKLSRFNSFQDID